MLVLRKGLQSLLHESVGVQQGHLYSSTGQRSLSQKGRVFVAVCVGVNCRQLLHELFVPPKMSSTRMLGKLADLMNVDKETNNRTNRFQATTTRCSASLLAASKVSLRKIAVITWQQLSSRRCLGSCMQPDSSPCIPFRLQSKHFQCSGAS